MTLLVRKVAVGSAVELAILGVAALLGLASSTVLAGEGADVKTFAVGVPMDRVTIEIVNVVFLEEVQGADGNRRQLQERQKNRYRFAVVTVRVRKPPGLRLTLAAADLTLHYYYEKRADVAPCEGISVFSLRLDQDRPLRLWQSGDANGPGWLKQTTGPRATDAAEVYLDAVFAMMEPGTRECWICVARPARAEPYISKGWSP